MRRRVVKDGVTVNAIAGTHVVLFGLDLAKSKRPGFRGFAFKRTDTERDEKLWLRSIKTFEATEPYPARGELFRTCDHPIQAFQWADYSVAPGQNYKYEVFALHGSAAKLKVTAELEIEVRTEDEVSGTHSAFFNRGSVATQEYARRFENQPPKDAGPGAYQWLSRGLLEALLAFINRAQRGWQIHGAVYEFQWPAVLAALKAAKDRGVDVQIIYDDIESYSKNKKTGAQEPKGPWKKNRQAIADAGIESLCQGRQNSTHIMHNKFFVLSKPSRSGSKPQAVWTGSTNLTENGIFGHSNVGHIVEEVATAQAFLDYWHRLALDPRVDKVYRAANSSATDLPPATWESGTVPIFSPRGSTKDLDSLNWCADVAATAQRALFMTFAFGMHDKFKDVYRQDDGVLRMALMEKATNSAKNRDLERRAIGAIRRRPNVVVAVGNRIRTNSFDRWLGELDKINPNVRVQWIHTKYMLVDPLGENPAVVSGSANFSKASTLENDENLVAIRGDKRIADIYLGEYLRLYAHYAFRESVARHLTNSRGSGAERPTFDSWKPQFLIDDDKWMVDYFSADDNTGRRARREYFSGPLAE